MSRCIFCLDRGCSRCPSATYPYPVNRWVPSSPNYYVDPGSIGFRFDPSFLPPARQLDPLASEASTNLLVGYRAWRVKRRYPEGICLQPVVASSSLWPERQRVEARCISHLDHKAPHHGCDCGLYATKEGVDVEDLTTRLQVVGSVYLWGRVIEHEDGYRAQYAYPKELALVGGPEKLANELSVTYGVPCECW